MKIATEIGSIAKFVGAENAVKLVGEAGFDAWDFTMTDVAANYGFDVSKLDLNSHLQLARKLRKIGESFGMVCNQAHAPYPSADPRVNAFLPSVLTIAAEAGAKICVIHPNNFWNAAKNIGLYAPLLPTAKDLGIKIAAENMWNRDRENDVCTPAACSDEEDFIALIDGAADENLVACLDVGHAELMRYYEKINGIKKAEKSPAVRMIYALNRRIRALHIHDNDLRHDDHALPYTGGIDFSKIIRALKDIKYDGYFTLELKSLIFSEVGIKEKVCLMQKVVRGMADEFDNFPL